MCVHRSLTSLVLQHLILLSSSVSVTWCEIFRSEMFFLIDGTTFQVVPILQSSFPRCALIDLSIVGCVKLM